MKTDNPTAVPPSTPDAHLTQPATGAVLTIQATMLAATRRFLTEKGFIELLPPIIGPVTDPGTRGSKQIDVDYYGHRYKLMTSAILYKQASLTAFERIFYIAPNVRLEPLETAVTHRHLAEFHQIDVEVRNASRDDVMVLAEELVRYVTNAVAEERPVELAALGRDRDDLRAAVGTGFGRRTHQDAVATLQRAGHPQDAGAEIDWEGEELLSSRAEHPFFITNYPKGSRGFYDREDPRHPGWLCNFDLIASAGFGELASGSEREYRYPELITRIRETGENPAKYGWYLDLARRGLPPSAGFGIGVERLTRYLAGCEAVWQASAYPKLPGVVSA